MKRFRTKLVPFLSGLMCLLMVGLPAAAKTLTIGTVSATPVEETRTFQPFADHLARLLAGDGIDAVNVTIAGNIPHMANLLKTGAVDLFIDSSVSALVVNELSGAQYMLRRWKKGRGQYRSVVFVRADSPILAPTELKGMSIAFEEPFSTSGYMLPALSLHQLDLELEELKDLSHTPSADRLGFIMAFDAETQTAWVERKRVHAAAMAEADFKDFASTALIPLRTLHTTPYVPYHVMTHRAGLEPQLVERIKTVLKHAHETEQGRAVLHAFERTTQFDDIPAALLDNVLDYRPYLHVIAPQIP